jgi:hypothetical protein
MRTPNSLRAALVAATVLLAATPALLAAQRTALGVRAGANMDYDDAFLGAHLQLPILRHLDFYPSMDVYFPNTGTRVGFNGDLRYRFPVSSALQPYAGGGLNWMHRSINSVNNDDAGASLLGGFQTRVGQVHPFFEGRILLHDNTSFQFSGGVAFRLSGR